jgi:hypothetical protein
MLTFLRALRSRQKGMDAEHAVRDDLGCLGMQPLDLALGECRE